MISLFNEAIECFLFNIHFIQLFFQFTCQLNDLSVKLDLSVKNGGQKMEMLTLSIHDQAQVSSLSSSQLNLHSTSNKSDTIDKQLPCSGIIITLNIYINGFN